MKNIMKYIFIIFFFIYEEILFLILSNIKFNLSPLIILFTIQISLILGSLLIFKDKLNKVYMGIVFIISSILYSVQFLYYKTFGTLLSINTLLNSKQVKQFSKELFKVMYENSLQLILILLPVFIYMIFIKKISLKKNTAKEVIICIAISLSMYTLAIVNVNQNNTNEIYSLKNLYYNINNMNENIKSFGIMTSMRLDVQRKIFNFKEKQLYKYEDKDGNTIILDASEYNITEIDFDNLIQNENNEIIKEIHNYIKTQNPTKKNKYTGLFKDKNLIVIMGESFSSLAINKELTPTLYKLFNQGIKFNNFYTPLFPVSTADGQYLSDTSLIPGEGLYSIQEVNNKEFPYVYGNVFKNLNYKTYAYHNYEYDYYKRDLYFNTFGYEKYLAKGNGLEERMDFSEKPSSDYDMVKATINDYIDEDKFLAYYVTMSGHLNYDKSNAIVRKNWNEVKNLNYSDKAKAYLATQIELDKALEEMIKTLKEHDRLDDTVIVLFGDHYPYGLTEKEIKELSPHNMNDYEFERFHMPFIIYNGEIQKTIEVDKYGSSLDILPTILNLFGIEYDSRLLMGKDILSDTEPLVIFSNRSFITNKGKYNSNIRRFYSKNKDNSDYSEYVQSIQKEIYLKYRYSRLILENNYYKYLNIKQKN